MILGKIRELRWRLKPIRWAGKLYRVIARWRPNRNNGNKNYKIKEIEIYESMLNLGYYEFKDLVVTGEIDLSKLTHSSSRVPFTNITSNYEKIVIDTFVRLLDISGVQASLNAYFNGAPRLWNVALNYSLPSEELTESQMWHFDYGDTKQQHFMIYFSDVDHDSGPFTFLPLKISEKIKRNILLIERLTNDDLNEKYNIPIDQSQIKLVGVRGKIYTADPGRLLHQGARCRKSRLVMFVTFTTENPMSDGGDNLMSTDFRRKLEHAYLSRCVNKELKSRTFW